MALKCIERWQTFLRNANQNHAEIHFLPIRLAKYWKV